MPAKIPSERNAQIRSLQSRFCVILTKPEGEKLSEIITKNQCANLSQLCKKIVNGEIKLQPVKAKKSESD